MVWANFHYLITKRDAIRDALLAYQDKPTDDNLSRVNAELSYMHTVLYNIQGQLDRTEVPTVDATGFTPVPLRLTKFNQIYRTVADALAGAELNRKQANALLSYVASRCREPETAVDWDNDRGKVRQEHPANE